MSEPEPFFRVTRGLPTADELAALVGALLVRRRMPAAQPPPRTTSAWARSARPGAARDGWRSSLAPR
ncbi:acyl-CoA carboxylase subunit epsilon [Phytohabitans sp. ZYX-F-186]|uniref:Acyl-CoA carboxylase subunit epsilon n=1 Tax=Phytohabitans maris TaxID=3071409 RepID=A0ABU0ZWY9_9ACTN|nr:acyl-CoA carboxylase subunit epsilon [Phytohabitans sp. ZYX-F-186]MDQ7911346.1 acyl-CoA carboxylase subunit epsilon [Phytohabitans sp. ZYX-F-186]